MSKLPRYFFVFCVLLDKNCSSGTYDYYINDKFLKLVIFIAVASLEFE